jgi:YVTN family beta-propeller protein
MGTKVSPDGKYLYITTGRSKMVLVLDTATNKIVGSVEAGPRPWGIAVAPDGAALYTANGPSNDISIIDAATREVTKKIAVGTGPWGIAVVQRSKAAR